MPAYHLFLALVVVIVWGLNFLFVKLALTEFSPLFLCALRFLFASIPAIFLIKPPNTSQKTVILYGWVMFALQFALLFLGMHLGMTPGIGSVLMQVQVFFSMFFAALFLKEAIHAWQILGAIISFFGIAIVGFHFDNTVTALGFSALLAGAATWGVGNLITKKMSNVNMISLVIWGSFYAFFPMIVLSLVFEGPKSILNSIHQSSWVGISALFYIVYASTLVGYGAWNWLLARYPVSFVAPFTLLVPIVGMLSSILFMGETFQLWKLMAATLVVTGLCINTLGRKFSLRRAQLKVSASLAEEG